MYLVFPINVFIEPINPKTKRKRKPVTNQKNVKKEHAAEPTGNNGFESILDTFYNVVVNLFCNLYW